MTRDQEHIALMAFVAMLISVAVFATVCHISKSPDLTLTDTLALVALGMVSPTIAIVSYIIFYSYSTTRVMWLYNLTICIVVMISFLWVWSPYLIYLWSAGILLRFTLVRAAMVRNYL